MPDLTLNPTEQRIVATLFDVFVGDEDEVADLANGADATVEEVEALIKRLEGARA